MNATQIKIERCQTLKELREFARTVEGYKFANEKGKAKLARYITKREAEIKAKKGDSK